MTNREFYIAVVANEISEEVIAHATNALAKLDERNAKRANTPSKTQIANEGLRADILGIIGEGMTAKAVGDHFGLSTQKVAPQLNALVDAGLAVKVKDGKVTLFKVAE